MAGVGGGVKVGTEAGAAVGTGVGGWAESVAVGTLVGGCETSGTTLDCSFAEPGPGVLSGGVPHAERNSRIVPSESITASLRTGASALDFLDFFVHTHS